MKNFFFRVMRNLLQTTKLTNKPKMSFWEKQFSSAISREIRSQVSTRWLLLYCNLDERSRRECHRHPHLISFKIWIWMKPVGVLLSNLLSRIDMKTMASSIRGPESPGNGTKKDFLVFRMMRLVSDGIYPLGTCFTSFSFYIWSL